MAMTFKDKELARLETQLVELGSYKEQVLLEPTVIYNNKMKELDHFLSTGLGESSEYLANCYLTYDFGVQ